MTDENMSKSTTIADKVDAMAMLSLFPALTVMIFLRRKLGYRFLDPIKVFVMAVLIVALPVISSNYRTNYGAANSLPYIFAVVMFCFAMFQRRLRWNDIKKGIRWHSRSRGISWLSALLPFSDSIVRRFVEPAVCGVVGFLVPAPLGHYLIFSGVCLFMFEAWDFDRMISQTLDTLDSLINSEVQAENVDYYSKGNKQSRSLEETAGIPTGIAPDIELQIQGRKSHKLDADLYSGV